MIPIISNYPNVTGLRAWTLSITALLALIVLSQPAPASAQDQQPNVVFILADDLGWTDVNAFDPLDRAFYETPNIDRLAHQGMMFTQAYTNAANCSPTRAALMSGQYYPRQPIYHVGSPGEGEMIPAENARHLPLEKQTIAGAFASEGYATALIGKWHIGSPDSTGPREQGFDVNIGGYMAGNPGDWKGGFMEPNNNTYIDDARSGEYLTDYLTRKAIAFISKRRVYPFPKESTITRTQHTPRSHIHMTTPFWQKPDTVDRFADRDPDHRLQELVDQYPNPAEIRVLDLGCAGGRNTEFLARRGFDVYALDASQPMVEETRTRVEEILGTDEAENRIQQGRMDDLSRYDDEFFELVVALGIYHNAERWDEWERAVSETARVLAPGGKLLTANFTPATDITGEGIEPAADETHVYSGFPSGRVVLLTLEELDDRMKRRGLEPAVPSEVVTAQTENGRRVTVNSLYEKVG